MPLFELRPDARARRDPSVLSPWCDTLPQCRQVRAALASIALVGLALGCGDRRIDVALGATQIPLQADPSVGPPSAPPCTQDPAAMAALEPSCEYTFDEPSCSATWSCDDGQLVTLTVAYGVSYGDFTCVTETHCVYGDVYGNTPSAMDSCGMPPAPPIACPVATEAAARAYCGPLVVQPVPAGCEPHQDSASPSP